MNITFYKTTHDDLVNCLYKKEIVKESLIEGTNSVMIEKGKEFENVVLQIKTSREEENEVVIKGLPYGISLPARLYNLLMSAKKLIDRGDAVSAEAEIKKILKLYEEVYEKHYVVISGVLKFLSLTLILKGDIDKAFGYISQSLKIDEKEFGPTHEFLIWDYFIIGVILALQGNTDSATSYLKQSLNMGEKVYTGEFCIKKAELHETLTYFFLLNICKLPPLHTIII
jgi:tetratricopeptide (TPR) repeat protein